MSAISPLPTPNMDRDTPTDHFGVPYLSPHRTRTKIHQDLHQPAPLDGFRRGRTQRTHAGAAAGPRRHQGRRRRPTALRQIPERQQRHRERPEGIGDIPEIPAWPHTSLIDPFSSPQLFVQSNHGAEETTRITYFTFIGTPVQATNMNDFKRVSNGGFWGARPRCWGAAPSCSLGLGFFLGIFLGLFSWKKF